MTMDEMLEFGVVSLKRRTSDTWEGDESVMGQRPNCREAYRLILNCCSIAEGSYK